MECPPDKNNRKVIGWISIKINRHCTDAQNEVYSTFFVINSDSDKLWLI